MSEFNDRFDGLDGQQRHERYADLAAAALASFEIGEANVIFIGHNGGVAYRVETARTCERFLLKIAAPVGDGAGDAPGRVQAVLLWLAALARETHLVVQNPVPNRRCELITAVPFGDLRAPFYCSLQCWIDGTPVTGDFTSAQAYRIGAMMATLHQHGSQWGPAARLTARDMDSAWITERERTLSRVADLGILSLPDWGQIEAACRLMRGVMDALGHDSQVWGPIHRDLHHRNVLFSADQARPIDFGDFTRAHFIYDLGVTLYHVMYQDDVSVRRALVNGYHSVRPQAEITGRVADAFLCVAALSNLSFQITIPRERASPEFARNVREFATVFCRQLVAGISFALT